MSYCPGATKSTKPRDWYIPNGYTSATCTCCNVCFSKYIKNTQYEGNFRKHPEQMNNCNCDFSNIYFINDKARTIQRDDVKVSIIENYNPKSTTVTDTCLIGPNGAITNNLADTIITMSNTATFDLVTNTPYVIQIKKYHHDDNNNNIWYSLKLGKVGNRDIIINNGEQIYYYDSLMIEGFKTGTNDSFLFLSLSEKDVAEGHRLDNNENSNCISLMIQKYRRVARRRPPPPPPPPPHPALNQKIPYTNIDFGALASAGQGGSVDGTVSGGQNVNHVETTQTNDIFYQIGEPIEFQIRLTCNMSEELKYKKNESYFASQLKKELEKEKTEINKQVNKLHVDLNTEYNKILEINKKIVDLQKNMS